MGDAVSGMGDAVSGVGDAVSGVVARPDLWASFIIPAYALTIAGLVGLLAWSYLSMRSAERRAAELRGERREEG